MTFRSFIFILKALSSSCTTLSFCHFDTFTCRQQMKHEREEMTSSVRGNASILKPIKWSRPCKRLRCCHGEEKTKQRNSAGPAMPRRQHFRVDASFKTPRPSSGTRCCRLDSDTEHTPSLPPMDGTVHGPRSNGTEHLPYTSTLRRPGWSKYLPHVQNAQYCERERQIKKTRGLIQQGYKSEEGESQ
jgi:hypothetical protein